MPLIRRILHRRKRNRIIMYPTIYHQAPILRTHPLARSELVDAPGLDVHGRDLGIVVPCEDAELDGAAPGRGLRYGGDVLLGRHAEDGLGPGCGVGLYGVGDDWLVQGVSEAGEGSGRTYSSGGGELWIWIVQR